MSVAEKEIAGGNGEQRQNETHEPKIYESGYFYLSQQINDVRDRMDAKFDRVDAKFEAVRKEIKDLSDKTDARFDTVHKEIKDLSDKTDSGFDRVDIRLESIRKETDARFDRVDEKFNDIHKEISGLQKWAFGLIVTVVLGFIAIYFK